MSKITVNENAIIDVEFSIQRLHHLICAICDKQFGEPTSHEIREHCDSLLWIARDLAENLKNDAHAAIWAGELA